MKIIFLISILSFILYKAGYITRLLNILKMDEEPLPQEEPEQTVITSREIIEGRDKWEAEARYILALQGKVNPDTVKYMGDEMLIRIIRDYLDI